MAFGRTREGAPGSRQSKDGMESLVGLFQRKLHVLHRVAMSRNDVGTTVCATWVRQPVVDDAGEGRQRGRVQAGLERNGEAGLSGADEGNMDMPACGGGCRAELRIPNAAVQHEFGAVESQFLAGGGQDIPALVGTGGGRELRIHLLERDPRIDDAADHTAKKDAAGYGELAVAEVLDADPGGR